MLSEISQTEKDKCCMISLILASKKVKPIKGIEQNGGCLGDWGVG